MPQRCLTRVDGCDELVSPRGKRCDFLLFAQTTSRKGHWAVPIELKSGTVKEQDLYGIQGQLQAGADVAEKRLPGERVRLRPVLGHGGMKPYLERQLTRPGYRVTLRGKSEVIRAIPCGDQIATALK